ncbi:MAG: ExbD/TolR family protein [bacterium]
MAYRPSLRRTRVIVEEAEPNMTPIMNLMVVLIPLLLSSAQLIRLSVIELNLPPAKGAKSLETTQNKEKELKLDLAVTITDQGFYVSSSQAILKNRDHGPSIPLKNGQFDYALLTKQLYEIKKKAKGRFKDTDSVIIQAEASIDYQTLVSTMDATRMIKLDGEIIGLFPNVSLSAVTL